MASAKYKKGKNGYYAASVWDGTYIVGTDKKHYKTIRSKKSSKDLERQVEEFRRKVEERRNVRNTDIKFVEYANLWLNTYKSNREGNTKSMYTNVINKHFVPLENVRLSDIDRIHLQSVLNIADGKPRTQQNIYMTFKQVIESAVADHLFPSNVSDDIFRSIQRPKYTPAEKRPLTSDERKAVFKADFNPQDKILVYILYGCGLRREEALALTIFDVNLTSKELTVNKAHAFVKYDPVQKGPKSKNGYRTVPIPDSVFPAVRDWVESCRKNEKTYLFTKNDGNPMTKSSYDKAWKRIVKCMKEASDSDIAGLTAHVFRHNYCTMLCYQIPSISIKHIAALLGDSERMVLEVYNHIIMEKEDASKAINEALG